MKTEIITLLLRLAIVIITGVIVPAVKKWIDSKTENEKLVQLRQAAETAVYAAEQLYHAADPDGEIRRRYAHKIVSVTSLRLGFALSEGEIDSLVQAAVQEINLLKYGGVLDEHERD